MIRKTNETYIEIINSKEMNIETGDPVLNHLLKTLFYYMEREVDIKAKYDLKHHLWEDVGITIGDFLKEEIKDAKIKRFGTSILPMDDALILVAVNISRSFASIELNIENQEEGFELGNFKEFVLALSRSLSATIHMKQINGENAHHIIEACFKSLGTALKQALEKSERIESTNKVYRV